MIINFGGTRIETSRIEFYMTDNKNSKQRTHINLVSTEWVKVNCTPEQVDEAIAEAEKAYKNRRTE